jgi:hypothetical protein
MLRWEQVDLTRRTVRVGKSKTEAGTGRVIPLNDKATKVRKFWADQFPDRKPEHFTFPSERYGAGGDDFEPTVFDVDPKTAIGSWKEAWESVIPTIRSWAPGRRRCCRPGVDGEATRIRGSVRSRVVQPIRIAPTPLTDAATERCSTRFAPCAADSTSRTSWPADAGQGANTCADRVSRARRGAVASLQSTFQAAFS